VLLSRMKKRGEVTPGEERGTWAMADEESAQLRQAV
jgi:hypothetical protein